jgi:hypothetical protein
MKEEQFIKLDSLLIAAEDNCPPDEYALRQRQLLHGIAEFLLEEYYQKLADEEEKDD